MRRALIWLCSALAAAPTMADEGRSPRRPNIVLILADDLGFSDIGPFGGEIRTPALDRLAAEGLRLSQFYNAARCCPTRASLLTGLHPHQAGMPHMVDTRTTYPHDLSDRAVTIAEALGAAGYRTAMAGKWHVTPGDRPPDEAQGIVYKLGTFGPNQCAVRRSYPSYPLLSSPISSTYAKQEPGGHY